ncbi:hypothetical protein BH10PSE19_BH10PSE19_17320 [soil metagenome]
MLAHPPLSETKVEVSRDPVPTMQNRLFIAMHKSSPTSADIDEIKALLQREDVSIFTPDEKDMSALTYACSASHVEVRKVILLKFAQHVTASIVPGTRFSDEKKAEQPALDRAQLKSEQDYKQLQHLVWLTSALISYKYIGVMTDAAKCFQIVSKLNNMLEYYCILDAHSAAFKKGKITLNFSARMVPLLLGELFKQPVVQQGHVAVRWINLESSNQQAYHHIVVMGADVSELDVVQIESQGIKRIGHLMARGVSPGVSGKSAYTEVFNDAFQEALNKLPPSIVVCNPMRKLCLLGKEAIDYLAEFKGFRFRTLACNSGVKLEALPSRHQEDLRQLLHTVAINFSTDKPLLPVLLAEAQKQWVQASTFSRVTLQEVDAYCEEWTGKKIPAFLASVRKNCGPIKDSGSSALGALGLTRTPSKPLVTHASQAPTVVATLTPAPSS